MLGLFRLANPTLASVTRGQTQAWSAPQVPRKGPGGATDGDLAAAGEAAIERGVLLFKLLGNLHAPSDYLPSVRPYTSCGCFRIRAA